MIAFVVSTLRSLRARKRALERLEADAPKRQRRAAR
jgi:hypothetical protein